MPTTQSNARKFVGFLGFLGFLGLLGLLGFLVGLLLWLCAMRYMRYAPTRGIFSMGYGLWLFECRVESAVLRSSVVLVLPSS